MSLLHELQCDVLKTDYLILQNLSGLTKPITYITVQNNDTIDIPRNGQEQIIVFNPIDNSVADTTVNLTIDTSASKIGDQITFMASVTDLTPYTSFLATFVLPPELWVFQCGLPYNLNPDAGSMRANWYYNQIVHTFTFDGSQFVCGYDNC